MTGQNQTQEQPMEQTPEAIAGTEPKAVHHQTKRGADMSLAKCEISRESHAAVLRGELSLQEARDLGRSAGPSGPVQAGNGGSGKPRKPKRAKEPRPCLACSEPTSGSRFHQGCDMKMFRVAREHLTEGRELTEAQMEYLESSGKMQRVKDKLADEEQKRQEKAKQKTEKK